MLHSLHIRNYRNLKNLHLEKTARVNLIIGKNNTGKTSLLEAVAIYAGSGNLHDLRQILESHGEFPSSRIRSDDGSDIEMIQYEALSSLFSNWKPGFTEEESITIGEYEDEPLNRERNISKDNDPSTGKSLRMKFVRFIEETERNEIIFYRQRKIFEDDSKETDYQLGFQITDVGGQKFYNLRRDIFRNMGMAQNKSDRYQLIKTANIDRQINGQLFDQITLTDKEEYVIQALRIIEPDTERIAFIESKDRRRERDAVIKLKNNPRIFPLKSMGDGINRILTIILALVNSENGYLLIDEFENGLHYSVQADLWEIVFFLAERLNIQVFATTHSEDCISGFEQVLNKALTTASGHLIRLDRIDGDIRQTSFDPEEMKLAGEKDIELR